jgi:hypothetical protein
MHKLRVSLAAASMFICTAALADPPAEPAAAKPAPDCVKQVWDYFEHGKGGGPVLGDAKLCTDISKSGDNKDECTAEVPASGVAAGTVVYLWQAYMVPKNDEVGDLSVQVKLNDTVRETKDVSIVKGTYWRQRTWSGVKLSKPGTWTLAVMRGGTALKTFTVKVQ